MPDSSSAKMPTEPSAGMPAPQPVPSTPLHALVSGRPDAPWLVLLHSLGCSHRLWDRQMPAFEAQFRVLRVDLPGHGASPVAAGGNLAGLVAPLLETLAAHGITGGQSRAHLCGISLGGMMAQYLAIHHPDRVGRVVLANTAARIGSPASWQDRISTVRSGGLAALAPSVMARWVTPTFARLHPGRVREIADGLVATPAEGYVRACEALAGADLRADLPRIQAPTLVIVGDADASTTPEDGQYLAEHIAGARLVSLRSAHLSNVEQPGEFARAVIEHCADGASNRAALRESGMAVRRLVLGDAYVDSKRQSASPEMLEFQDFITEAAWGQVWTRPGLSRRDRSMLVMAITLTANREAEFVLHLKASRNNGVTRAEVKELILQAAVYAGVPAANHAMNLAQSVWAQEDAAAPGAA